MIRLSVNGEELTEIELRPARERYPLELPLREGVNEIAMRFRYAGDPNRSSADRRRLAVAFYRFDILPEGEAPVARSPGPFAWVSSGLHLPAGGAVTLYADVPGDARLRLTPGDGVDVVVRSEESTLVEKTLAGEEVWEQGPTCERPRRDRSSLRERHRHTARAFRQGIDGAATSAERGRCQHNADRARRRERAPNGTLWPRTGEQPPQSMLWERLASFSMLP